MYCNSHASWSRESWSCESWSCESWSRVSWSCESWSCERKLNVSFPGLCCIYHLQYRNFCVDFLLQATNMKGEACTGFGSGKLELGKVLLTLYSGNFRGRKLSSQISKFCRYLWIFSLQNLGAWHLLAAQLVATANTPWKFSPGQSIFHQFAKFFFSCKFPTIL